jgi:hypothetical protein
MRKETLDHINFFEVHEHYENRISTSKKLQHLLKKADVKNYVKLSLGMSDASGNYSAAEHNLGPQILASTSDASIFDLAKKLNASQSPLEILELIYRSAIRYLKVSVGSEMAMMLRPQHFWVANTRSIWAYFWIEYKFNRADANLAVSAYREDKPPDMDYRLWKQIYTKMPQNLLTLGELGTEAAQRRGLKEKIVVPYLWCDAVASALYAQMH